MIEKALAAAYSKIISARENLLGRRGPLAGTYTDPEQALVDLRAAQHEIAEAIRLIETHR